MGAQLTEAELQREVVQLLEARPDLTWHHCAAARRCQGHSGLPDLLVIGRRRVIWRELKGEDTRHRSHQLAYADVLARAGQSVATWRPADLASGAILAEIESLR